MNNIGDKEEIYYAGNNNEVKEVHGYSITSQNHCVCVCVCVSLSLSAF